MPKSEAMELELADLLHKTSNMTRDKAQMKYDAFVKETETRIEGVIYRLNTHYNIGRKLNAINKQSNKTKKSFSQDRRKKGKEIVDLKVDTKPG